MKPNRKRVAVRHLREEGVSQGGIIMTSNEMIQNKAVVVSLGVGKPESEYCVQPGDTVIVNMYGGTEITVNEEVLRLIDEDDILGIISE